MRLILTPKNVNMFIRSIIERIPKNYTVIVTDDHGGHDRCNGINMPEDKTILLIINSDLVEPDKLENVIYETLLPMFQRYTVSKSLRDGKELF